MDILTREEKKIARARVAMMIDTPFFGHIAMQLELVEREDLTPPTMGTDGYRLYYHPGWVSEIPEEQLKGIIAHEVGHLILMHLTRKQNREKIRWNHACDFAVNDLVKKEFELPDRVLYNPNFADKTAEWIYNQLPETQVIEVTVTLDSHDDWMNGNGNGKEEKGDGENETAQGAGGGENGDEDDGKAPAGTHEGLEQRIREMVAQSATQARMKGKLPGHLKELVEGVLQPRLDWKTILQDMIVSCAKSDFTMFPANKKHLYRGYILPGITGSEINIACIIDTSGSISNEEMKEFLAEVKGICDAYEQYMIYLFTCDAQIQQRWEIQPFDPLPTVLAGRGGTDFREPLQEAENLPITSIVYLTDGYGTYPDKEPVIPVIWVSTTDYEYPWGQVIRLPERK
jgi:predicted metal-dependent peptidase